MSTAFNPFHEWLGLAANVTKPNYYQLLGLDEFEENAAEISAAVDRTIATLQNAKPGAREKQHAKLLNQLKHVQEALLNPQTKSTYDEKLRKSKQTSRETKTDVTAESEQVVLPPQVSTNATGQDADLLPEETGPMLPPPAGAAVDPMAPVNFSPQATPIAPLVNVQGPELFPANKVGIGQAPISPSQSSAVRDRAKRPKKSMALVLGFGFFVVLAIAIGVFNNPPEQLAELLGKQSKKPVSPPIAPVPKKAAKQPVKSTRQTKRVPLNTSGSLPFKGEASSPMADLPDLPDLTSDPAGSASSSNKPEKKKPTKKKETTKKSAPDKNAKQPSAKDLEALGKALTMARDALDERDFTQAEVHLKRAEGLAELPEHKEMVVRLNTVAMYVQQFWVNLSQVLGTFKGGEEIQVKNTVVSVVDANSMMLVIRVAGMNKTYTLQKLPSGLAMSIADKHFDENDPNARLMRGAVHLVDENGKFEEVERLWEEAINLGADIESLLPAIGDNYDFSRENDE